MKYGSNSIIIGIVIFSALLALIINKVLDYTNSEGFQMDPASKIKTLLNSIDFADDTLHLNIPLVVEKKMKLGGNAVALKPRNSNAECRLIFDNVGKLGQLRHKFVGTGASTIMPNFGIDEYNGKSDIRKRRGIVRTMDTLRPTDVLLYGRWISHGSKNMPVDEVRKEENGYSFISQRGRYVKIVKTDEYFENHQGYYYDGKISEYGRKGLRRAPNGAYIIKLAPNRILNKGTRPVNVATKERGAYVKVRGIWPHRSYRFKPEYLIDPNLNKFVHSRSPNRPWNDVYLSKVYPIHKLSLVNIHVPERLQNPIVEFYNGSRQVHRMSLPVRGARDYSVNVPKVKANRVRIINPKGHLHLANLKIFTKE